MAKKPTPPIPLEGFTYTGEGCRHCLTDGQRDHAAWCETLEAMSPDERRLATMSYAEREREAEQSVTVTPAQAVDQSLQAIEPTVMGAARPRFTIRINGQVGADIDLQIT